MFIRKCTSDDLTELIRIGRETYYEAFYSLNTRETMDVYLNEAFSREKILTELTEPASRFYFCYSDSKNTVPAAYFKINLPSAQTDLNEEGSLELERIYVCSEYQGTGVGKIIIEEVVRIARAEGFKRIWLGVWKKNSGAVIFYHKMGFVVTGTHRFRMGDELQSDYIMTRELL